MGVVGRRAFLHTAIAAVLGSPACAPRRFAVARPRRTRRLVPVRVAPERVIRTIAGLRPFRPSGFVVRAEPGRPVIVHNYGHGGAGITLSWGTAQLAVDAARQAGASLERAAVVGAGAVGLATARLLQRRGAAVTIHARELPPETTSNVAGGQWGPFSVFDRGRTTPEFDAQLARATALSFRLFQDLAGPEYGIRWIENYAVGDAPFTDRVRDFAIDIEDFGPGEHPFPARYARRFTTMLIETPIYLNAMLRDFFIAGGRVVVRELRSKADLLALDAPVVFNCTGLGARALIGDEELVPVKGQLTFLLPQPEVDYITLAGGLYMFPRRDGILLGGTFERGDWSLEPDPAAERRILEGHRAFFARMR
ncbi:MAG TPA: FAD-dependent oxidoreductase [Vicinamibacterales bacterium]|nr:FAD-dependent oxidoreductase [Vicinamibacterales bacterium]